MAVSLVLATGAKIIGGALTPKEQATGVPTSKVAAMKVALSKGTLSLAPLPGLGSGFGTTAPAPTEDPATAKRRESFLSMLRTQNTAPVRSVTDPATATASPVMLDGFGTEAGTFFDDTGSIPEGRVDRPTGLGPIIAAMVAGIFLF